MPSPPTIDLPALSTPIPGTSPAGDWLPDVHSAIEQARRSDDDLPQGDWKRETKAADWRGVIKIATDALTTRTKDLKTAAFLVEALVKQHGLAGLRDGLQLLRELHERFWDSLHPQIEDGDLEGRAAPIEWLNGKLPASVKGVAVTRSRSGTQYSLLQWEESRAVDNLGRQNPEAREQAIAEGKVSGEQFDKAVAATPRAFYEDVAVDLGAASDQWQALTRVIDEKFGRDAPSLIEVRNSLEQCRDVVGPILRRKRELEPDPTPGTQGSPAPSVTTAEGGAGEAAAPASGIDPVDRADALRRLGAVAAFFRRTEPHSPVAYLVQRSVQWGQMPLEQWLREVIHDPNVLAHVRETLGLAASPPATPGGE
jgi:type VI secretion system protein ImpA